MYNTYHVLFKNIFKTKKTNDINEFDVKRLIVLLRIKGIVLTL